MKSAPTVDISRCVLRRQARSDSSGFTLIELLVAMAITLLVMSLIPAVLETTTTASSNGVGISTAAAQAQLAIQNLDSQVASAIQVCLPTQLTDPSTGSPLTAASGFAVRVEQVEATTDQWEQWLVNTSTGLLQEERYTLGGTGSWVTVAQTIYNSSSLPPFSTPNATVPQTQPEELLIDLQVSEHSGRLSQKLEISSAVSAFSTPYTLSPTPLCSSVSAAPED